jgi:hypothetical protein
LLKFRDAFAEGVPLFGFVVNAAAEDFDVGLDVVESAADLCKVLGDRCEFARAGVRECLNETVHMSEADLHSREALADRLLQSVQPLVKFWKYSTAPMAGALVLWNPRHGFWKVGQRGGDWLGHRGGLVPWWGLELPRCESVHMQPGLG